MAVDLADQVFWKLYRPQYLLPAICWYGRVLSLLNFYKYLCGSGTDRHKILHDGRYGSRTDLLPFCGAV